MRDHEDRGVGPRIVPPSASLRPEKDSFSRRPAPPPVGRDLSTDRARGAGLAALEHDLTDARQGCRSPADACVLLVRLTNIHDSDE